MSNETIKLEADCAVATYNHHHHHHHHQNPHLQPHHNPISHHQVHHVLTSSHPSITLPPQPTPSIRSGADIKEAPYGRVSCGLFEDEEQENKHYSNDFKSTSPELDACNRPLMQLMPAIGEIKLSGVSPTVQDDHTDHQHQSLNHSLVLNTGDKYTQLESVNPEQIIQRDAIQKNQYQTATTSFSSSSDSSESSEDDEIDSEESDEDERVVGDNEADGDEYGDEDDGDDEEEEEDEEDDDDDEEDDDDDEEEDEDASQDQDCDDIVDPVGHHHQYMHHQISNGQTILNESYQSAITNNNESNTDDEDDGDISFENVPDDTVSRDSLPSDLSLNSERMLEVTRKLVRSTERDPDRDLRKQVLLRTAIRRLPHFMESSCNHYSDTFDQNFRLHNNTMNDNNGTILECLSPSQYYENHNIYHLESTQPKSYYHSVQPNAIQMSTTSLKMLDLNDDQDSEIATPSSISGLMDSSTTLVPKHPHLVNYESSEHENHHVPQTNATSLEQHRHQHEYANSNLYNNYSHHHHHHQQQHESQLNQIQDLKNLSQVDQRTVMHDFNQFDNVDQNSQGSSSNIIARHSTLENLYQPLADSGTSSATCNDIGNELKTATVEPTAFQSVHDYSRIVVSPEHHHCYDPVHGNLSISNEDGSVMDSMDQSLAITIASTITTTPDRNKQINDSDVLELDETPIDRRTDEEDLNNNRHQYQTTTTTNHAESIEPEKLLEDSNAHDPTSISLTNEYPDETTISNRLNDDDQASNCLDGGSNSSQSSTSSDDSVNSSTQSNDSAGDSNGTSILETSLNSTNEYHYRSHDSGVALFSPKSNKRTSSSIGFDDEMDIDHLSSDHLHNNHHHMTNSDQVFTGSVANHCKRLRKKEIID